MGNKKRAGKKSHKHHLHASSHEIEDLDEFVKDQLIVESGRDVEGRPIFAFYGNRFPDPKVQDYDELLAACLKRLDDFVRNDYVIVFFAEPRLHTPSVGWMISAYKKLSRDYKKNVKKLYIVHCSWWFRIVLGFLQKIVSSKFAAKIEIVDYLARLPDLVPCEAIDIPDEIKLYDSKLKGAVPIENAHDEEMTSKSLNKTRAGRRKEKLFGKDLSAVTAGAIETPDPILSLITYLKYNGLNEDGLFRKSPSTNEINSLKERLDNDMEVQWSQYDIPTLAGLLKAYIRELPEPLIPPQTYMHLTDLTRMEGKSIRCQYIQQSFLSAIDEQNMVLLKEVVELLKETLDHSARNKMSMKSLTTVWAPNLIRHAEAEEELRRLDASRKLVECMIEYYDDLF